MPKLYADMPRLITVTLQNELPKVITGKGAAEIIRNIRTDVNFIQTLRGEVREAAISAYQVSMRVTFIFIAVTAFLAVSPRSLAVAVA